MKETLIWGKIPLKDDLSHEIVVQNKRLVFSSKNDLISFKIATSDSDVEDSFQSNMGMQQIQQNLSIPIGDKKYKNRTGLLNYQLGRL